jgi:gamma-glutamyltranspeptidase/glutathione hydrolase
MPHSTGTRTRRRLRSLLGQLGPRVPSDSGDSPSPGTLSAPRAQVEPNNVWFGGRGPVYLPSGDEFEFWKSPWTTRPELTGTFGAVASGEHLASAAGLRVLELGGNAFDAAVATGLCLWHTDPGNTTAGGECSVVFWTAADDADGAAGGQLMQCSGQGRMPAQATVQKYKELGHTGKMPHSGLLAACTPGAMDAYLLLLSRHGTMRPREVFASMLEFTGKGVPMSPNVYNSLGWSSKFMHEHWPTSAQLFLDADGNPPAKDGLWRNPMFADCCERLLAAGELAAAQAGADSPEAVRQAEIEGMRQEWRTGFVAEAVVEHCQHKWATSSWQPLGPEGPKLEAGLITKADMAGCSARIEPAVTYEYKGWRVGKCGPWSQGPVFLQQLALLEGFELDKMAPDQAEWVHTLAECTKLAYADRELYYGDPDFVDVPLAALLSEEYNAARRKLVDPQRASPSLIPGKASVGSGSGQQQPVVDGSMDCSAELRASVQKQYAEATTQGRLRTLEEENGALKAQLEAAQKALGTSAAGGVSAAGTAGMTAMIAATAASTGVDEFATALPPDKFGPDTPLWMKDTTHLCAADRFGNLVSIIPSGATFTGSPVIAGLGFPTSTRGMMLTLEEGAATTLRGGERPRTTLSPTVALKDGKPDFGLAFGSPGGE